MPNQNLLFKWLEIRPSLEIQRQTKRENGLMIFLTGIVKLTRIKIVRKFLKNMNSRSHDGFKTESNGYFSPDNPKYADQVYKI